MAKTKSKLRQRTVRNLDELASIERDLEKSVASIRAKLREIVDDPHLMDRLKFERLGCHPIDAGDPQNLIEQINLHATYEAAARGLRILMTRHEGREWSFKPGADSSGPDLASTDGTVEAEVFAMVTPTAMGKLPREITRMSARTSEHRYVVYVSPKPSSEFVHSGGVTVIPLLPKTAGKRSLDDCPV